MAYEINGFSYSGIVVADYTLKQHCFLTADATGTFVLSTAAANTDGILQNDPDITHVATIMQGGISQMVVGVGGVTVGDLIEVGTTGRGITRAAGITVGRALSTGAEDTKVSVLLY